MIAQSTQEPPNKVQQLGSAKAGVGHWRMQRVTAVLLVPLVLWWVASLIAHVGSGYAGVIHWLSKPAAAVLTILLLLVLFRHTALGLQVIVEDYVHCAGLKWLAVLAIRTACTLLVIVGVLSVTSIALNA
jgi:succinate dehydrogenase / fumarate reductase membrane anchor subunit